MAVEHWIRYQLALGAGCRKTGEAIAYFGSAEKLFSCSEYEWKLSGIFTPQQIAKLKKSSLSDAYQVIEDCRKVGCNIVTPDDKLYPRMLKGLDDLPAVLYYRGDLRFLIHKIAIAVVGTREADENSLSVAKSLSSSLCRSGAIVISGGALGVDSAAHTGAIEAKGKTAAVLGNGFGANYLSVNDELRSEIAQNGAVITEYPPFTPAIARNFPIRNRIISGLSHGTVVIEAGVKSGSLITANIALEQGRDVFAVPGNVMSEKFKGVHKLINDGAKPVFCAMDILEGYAIKYPSAIDYEKIETELTMSSSVEKINTKTVIEEKKTNFHQESLQKVADLSRLSEEAKAVYAVFGDEPIHIDDIIRKTGLGFSKVFSSVTELELAELIGSSAGKLYHKITN